MRKSFIYPILFMALITAFFTFILAFMDYSTAEKIAFLEDTDLRKKILYVFDINIKSDEPERIDEVFQANIEEKIIDGKRIFYLMENYKQCERDQGLVRERRRPRQPRRYPPAKGPRS